MAQIFPSWRDELSKLAFPFSDTALPTTTDGEEIPAAVLVDVKIHPPGAVGGYYLESIVVSNTAVAFVIYDGDNQRAAVGEWNTSLHDKTVVPLYSPAGEPSGVLIVNAGGVLGLGKSLGEGQHFLQQFTSLFVPSTWDYVAKQTTEQQRDGVEITNQGDLFLVAEDGVRFECLGDNEVVVHAIGLPLAKRQTCGEKFESPRYIRQLVFQLGQQTVSCPASSYTSANIVVVSKDAKPSALRLNNRPGEITLGFLAAKES